MNTIFLEPAMVPQTLRGSYNGKMFKAVVTETVNIHSDAGLWSGGSRDHYSGVDIDTGASKALPMQGHSPFDGRREEQTITLVPGFAVVRHSMFCGKDMGLTFYVHPDNAAKLLPVNVELTPHEKIVLLATSRFKSSYGGQDRYQMAKREYDCKEYPTREQWDAAKVDLIARGLLLKSGAITPKGRNAVSR